MINKIKTCALNARLFRQLCGEKDEKFKRLLLHREVHWFSKGSGLKRFFSLYDAILHFLISNREDNSAVLIILEVMLLIYQTYLRK